MGEEQVLAMIKRRIEGWPKDSHDVLGSGFFWSDGLPDQDRAIAYLFQELREPQVSFLEPHVIYEFLQARAREFGYAMVSGRTKISDVPSSLVAWALLVAGDAAPRPSKRTGRPLVPGTLRNLKILSVADYLRQDLGYTREAALRLIGRVIGRDRETVVTALRNAKLRAKTKPGAQIMFVLECDIRGQDLGFLGEHLGLENPG